MKNSLLKKSFVCSFIFALLFTCVQVMQSAKIEDEDILLEGEMGKTGPRSIEPGQQVHAFLRDNVVNIQFFVDVPTVSINIKDINNNVVYSMPYSYPKLTTISLDNLESGCYKLELVTPTGYTFGSFMYVY